jgi:hypothetical protein
MTLGEIQPSKIKQQTEHIASDKQKQYLSINSSLKIALKKRFRTATKEIAITTRYL